ncbi:hypothetical protein HanLR1_Chr08g0271681 [Helianthus annuus]|nr:hypothetical protein HanLR1_Chr08g0271681 [Helianthus annuus]
MSLSPLSYPLPLNVSSSFSLTTLQLRSPATLNSGLRPSEHHEQLLSLTHFTPSLLLYAKRGCLSLSLFSESCRNLQKVVGSRQNLGIASKQAQ